MKHSVLWVIAFALVMGPACAKRETVVPLVYEPGDGVVGSVGGRVFDAATGQPMAGVAVAVWNAERGTATDKAGSYMIAKELKPGRYTLIANVIGYLPERTLVEICPGQTTAADFRLKPRQYNFK